MTEAPAAGATEAMKSAVVPLLVCCGLLALGCDPGPGDESGGGDTGAEDTSGGVVDTGMPPVDTGGDEGTSDTGTPSTDSGETTGGTSGSTGEPGTDSGDDGDTGDTGDSGGETDDTGTTGGAATCDSEEWEDSLAAYEALAEANDDTYWYAQTTGGPGAFELECGYLTTVEVVQGVVIRRTHEINYVPEGWVEAMCADDEFVEEADAINTTPASYAPPALTMEEQYSGCCELLALQPAEEYIFYFDVDESGVANLCRAAQANCADGCNVDADGFGGFSITELAFGVLP